MSKKPHTKKRSYIRDKQYSKDYAGTEASPYREWVGLQQKSEQHNAEPPQGNPDVVPESKGLYYQAPCEDDRLELIQAVYETLTPRQQEILRMCGNEGRTIANCAAILKISRSTVQKTIDRIRVKVFAIQESTIRTIV